MKRATLFFLHTLMIIGISALSVWLSYGKAAPAPILQVTPITPPTAQLYLKESSTGTLQLILDTGGSSITAAIQATLTTSRNAQWSDIQVNTQNCLPTSPTSITNQASAEFSCTPTFTESTAQVLTLGTVTYTIRKADTHSFSLETEQPNFLPAPDLFITTQ